MLKMLFFFFLELANPFTLHCALTESWLAMQDVEVVVHAGCQQEVLLGWMPLQPPHSSAHGSVAERLPHVPAVPQQHVLVVAAGCNKGHWTTGVERLVTSIRCRGAI